MQDQELTFGQKAVGLKFNPSNDDEVGKCKQQFADLIDSMNDLRKSVERGDETGRHASIAITMLEDAQTRAVKAITWKYNK